MALVKSASEIKLMRRAGAILARALVRVSGAAKEGVRLTELDKLAREVIEAEGGVPAFLGYRPAGADKAFPATICASVNEVVVHGVPSNYALKSGDVLKLDFGAKFKGYYSDAAVTVPIGKVAPLAVKLIRVTREALETAIQVAVSGATLGDIGYAIHSTVTRGGFTVIRGLTGHAIGQRLHEDPSVPNEGYRGKGLKLLPGMVFAIEPMVSAGAANVIQQNDEGYRTADGSLSAHFEHTVLITESGPEILTVV